MHVRNVRLNNRTDSVLSYERSKHAASCRSGAGNAFCCCHDMVRHRREERVGEKRGGEGREREGEQDREEQD